MGMEKNKTLLNLYLKDNSIRDKGAKAFAEALSHKSFLQVNNKEKISIKKKQIILISNTKTTSKSLSLIFSA